MVRHEIYRMEFQIDDSDIDIMGHVNNVTYVRWMQAAAVAHSDANGWNWSRYRELGAGWVARAHQIEYFSSALKQDQVFVETWVSGLKRATSTRAYCFRNMSTGETLVRAETRWAFVSLEAGTPVRIPRELLDSFNVVKWEPQGG